MIYCNEIHQLVFEEAIHGRDHSDWELMAAIYLLTADYHLWRIMRRFVVKNDIRFDLVSLPSMSERRYLLYRTARDLYSYDEERSFLSIRDLSDLRIMSNAMYDLISTGIAIRRFGLGARVTFRSDDMRAETPAE